MRMSSLFGTHSQFIVKPNLQGTLEKLSKTVKIQNGSCVIVHPERNHHDMVHFNREEVHLYGKEISGLACPVIIRYHYDSINHVINLYVCLIRNGGKDASEGVRVCERVSREEYNYSGLSPTRFER